MILRMEGKIVESLELLKRCHILDERNIEILKQISKTLYLLGKLRPSLEITEEALKQNQHDWVLNL